jgi:BirA family biotin operon repressor/biotin-[acetyl-CoA-carboxylase] ligase
MRRSSASNRYSLAKLRPMVRPFRLHWFSRLGSTNDHAAAMRRQGRLFGPAIVLTGHQLAGRGRGSNTWWSGPGCMTVTFALAAREEIAPHQVPLLAGLAVRNAAAELTGEAGILLKWPNDLLFDGKKLAGLLCERVEKLDLIGLGLNVNVLATDPPSGLRNRVTSLSQIARRPIEMGQVLATVARHLHDGLVHAEDRSFQQALREYDRHHALVGRRIRVIGVPGEPVQIGICKGMDAMGRLLLRADGQTSKIISGHVVLEG